MKRFMRTLAVVGLAVMLGASLLTSAYAAEDGRIDRPFSCLTEEQRDAVHAKIQEMRAVGADPEEIHNTVRNMLKDYGVQNPDKFGRGPHGRAFLSELTEEQRKAVHEKMSTMRESGASREETRAEVAEMLKGYGVEVPEGRGLLHRHQAVLSELTEEQRKAVQEKMSTMRESGASRGEIHAEVAEMLKGYGVEVPDMRGGPGRHMDGFSRLTEGQRHSVREKIRGMHEAGKSREEIHAQVREMLKGYGVEVRDRSGRDESRRSLMAGLSEEQRKAVRKKIKSMREAGASREEIRAAVSGMLEGYGIKPRNGSGQMLGRRGDLRAPRLEAQSHPNPASSEVDIDYVLPAASEVRIRIYNTSGQLVRSYDLGEQAAGRHSVRWDGKSLDGITASSGLYLYRIEAGGETATDCIVLIK